jgi:hypothetical protein
MIVNTQEKRLILYQPFFISANYFVTSFLTFATLAGWVSALG